MSVSPNTHDTKALSLKNLNLSKDNYFKVYEHNACTVMET